MQNKVVSVSVFSNYIKNIFDAETLLYNISISGEISNFSPSGDNVFFSIKDQSALLNCVMFGYDKTNKFKIGDKVVVTGFPRYYVKGGKLNFNVSKIEMFGEGDIYKRFLLLKQKLEQEGLFDPLHKLPLPKEIKRIGVVTSETGAVIHDIINVATRRNSAQDIVLYPIKVQGIGADIEIAKGINFFSDYPNVDAIIVGRGGGSEEDLQNFNSEIVARAVYNCKKFIVSAVGHETDNTICDLVADLRAPTPSAAAELLTKDSSYQKRELSLIIKNISEIVERKLAIENINLQNNIHAITAIVDNKLSKTDQQLEVLKLKLQKNNPIDILKKGYAKIEVGGKSIKSTAELKLQQMIDVYLADGKIKTQVTEINHELRKQN